MADTKRTLAALLELYKSGLIKNISAQIGRDFLVSVFNDMGWGSAYHTTAAELKDAVGKKHAESHNAASHSDIASSGADIDDAVSKKHSNASDHTQGTDQKLDDGGDNEVAVADVKDAVDDKHAATVWGTKEVDETDIGDGKVPIYRTVGGKYKLETPVVGISELKDDPSPQLGGELDCQAHSIGFT